MKISCTLVFVSDHRTAVDGSVWSLWTPGQYKDYVAPIRRGKSSWKELRFCSLHE